MSQSDIGKDKIGTMVVPRVECLIIDEAGRSIWCEHGCNVGWDEERGLYQTRRESGLYIESAFDGSEDIVKATCHFFVHHIALSQGPPRCRAPVPDMDSATKHSCPHFEMFPWDARWRFRLKQSGPWRLTYVIDRITSAEHSCSTTVRMEVNRALINSKFEGYRLSLIAQDDYVSRFSLQYPATQATVSGKSPLSFQEVQSRISHNHFTVPRDGSRALYVDASRRVISVNLNGVRFQTDPLPSTSTDLFCK